GFQQSKRGPLVFLDAGRNFGRLLGHMHVNFEVTLVSKTNNFAKVSERHGAHTVRSDANPRRVGSPTVREGLIRRLALAYARASDIADQRFQVLQIDLRIAFDKARLFGIRLSLKP